MSEYPRFHLAFPVTDLESTRRFYCDVLGCTTGRESDRWIDFDFFGHQLVAHLVAKRPAYDHNEVDGDAVPAFHFGPVLDWDDFHALADRLKTARLDFLIGPRVRFCGGAGEQATLFVRDPCGNALEFKAFRNPAMLFAKNLGDE